MKDLLLIFYILSLFTAVSNLSITIFIHKVHNNKSLRCYIGLIFSFLLIQSTIFLNYLLSYIKSSTYLLTGISKGLDILGTSLSSLFGLMLVHYLYGKEFQGRKKKVIMVFCGVQFLGMFLNGFLTDNEVLKNLVRISIVFVVFYEIAVVMKEFRNSKNQEVNKIVRNFLLLTLIFLPLLIFEMARPYIGFINDYDVLKIFSSPIYFLFVNIYSLYISATYFNTPVNIKDNKLTEYFIKKYGITRKETEVMELMMTGMTYKQISEILMVSSKTVDNHVQNIYKKLKVYNKVQLLNLIRSKEC